MSRNIHFNTQHAPFGAHASLTLGFPGVNGGMDLERCLPPQQQILVALESAEAPNEFEALPFIEPESHKELMRFISVHGDIWPHSAKKLTTWPLEAIERDFGLACDAWSAGDLAFSLYSPVGDVPDPAQGDSEALRLAVTPTVWAELTVDNRQGKRDRRVAVGFSRIDPYRGLRQVGEEDGLVGLAEGGHLGVYCAEPGAWVGSGMDWRDILGEVDPASRSYGLGRVGAVCASVPAGQIRTLRFAFCFYREGQATTGMNTRYFYTRYFDSIEAVARGALSRFDEAVAKSREADARLNAANLSDEQKFIIASATRSYLFSTQLLEREGQPLWVVNEGEYNMINTLDLVPDHSLYEMHRHPWTIRSVLDLFAERYVYEDEVSPPEAPGRRVKAISFPHDMGASGVFSKPHHSAYERPELTGCFSYMTMEELLNWVLTAGLYFGATDDKAWVGGKAGLLAECLESLEVRDHPDEARRIGLMRLDSSRCQGGREITTYDCLDHSLGQASGNTYLASKTWAAGLVLERMFLMLGEASLAARAGKIARRCADTVVSVTRADGRIPALVDGGSDGVLTTVIEGLAYAWFGGVREAFEPAGPFSAYLEVLKKHFVDHALKPDTCIAQDGSWRITSSNANTFPAKIYVCQFVARKVLGLDVAEASRAQDLANYAAITHPEHSVWCWSEQIKDGIVHAAKYYPRGVTSNIWLYE